MQINWKLGIPATVLVAASITVLAPLRGPSSSALAAAAVETVQAGATASPFGMPAPAPDMAAAVSTPSVPSNTSGNTDGLSDAERRAIDQAIQASTDKAAERARLTARALALKSFDQWQTLHEGPMTKERQAKARQILDDLPGRLDRRELLPEEAIMIHIAVVDDADIAPEQRDIKLAVLRQHLEAYVPKADPLANRAVTNPLIPRGTAPAAQGAATSAG